MEVIEASRMKKFVVSMKLRIKIGHMQDCCLLRKISDESNFREKVKKISKSTG